MASGNSGARLAEDRWPDGVFRLRQSELADALWRLAEREPETVRQVIQAMWVDHNAYPYPSP